MARLFLDSSVLVSAITGRDSRAFALVFSSGKELVTNEYALKETRRVLLKWFGSSPAVINEAIDKIRHCCTVLPTPSKEAFQKIVLDDQSDTPIVASALQAGAILVTSDRKLLLQARKYVETSAP